MNLKNTLGNIHKSKNNFFNINEKIYFIMNGWKVHNLYMNKFRISYEFSKDLFKNDFIIYGIDSKKPYVYKNYFCERL
jgi:hypothetical protein